MLVVRKNRTISHPLVYKVPEVEDITSSPKKKSGKNRDLMAKTT